MLGQHAWCWFWQEEAHHNAQVLEERRRQLSRLQQRLTTQQSKNRQLVAANAVLEQDITALQQQLDHQQQQQQQQQQPQHSHKLPPCSGLSKLELTAQLEQLQSQRDSNQATLEERHAELSVLATIPEMCVGRLVAGDTVLDGLQEDQQQLEEELQAVIEEAEQDLDAIGELQAEVSQLQSMGRAQDREVLLQAQLLTQTLQHELGSTGSSHQQRQCDSSSSSSSMTTSSTTLQEDGGGSMSQELSSLSDSLEPAA